MDHPKKTALTPEIGETEFEADVLRSGQPVLVAFLVAWSRPCEVLKPVLEEVTQECCGRVKVFTVNTDDHLGLGLSYEIQSVPTMIYFVEGRERIRMIGTASKSAILAKMRSLAETSTT